MVLTLASGPAGHNFILLLESPAQRTGKIQLTHLPTESFIVFTSLGYIKEKSMVMLPPPSFDKRLALLESLPPFMAPSQMTLGTTSHSGYNKASRKMVRRMIGSSACILCRPHSQEFGMTTRGRAGVSGVRKHWHLGFTRKVWRRRRTSVIVESRDV